MTSKKKTPKKQLKVYPCIHCKAHASDHADNKCLFASTQYEEMTYKEYKRHLKSKFAPRTAFF